MIAEFTGKYRFLSNFYIEPDGTCVEIEYQLAKCKDPAEHMLLLTEGYTPTRAKKLGQKVQLRDDWEAVKLDIMRNLVRRKFTDSSRLQKLLLATGDQELVEGNYWGDTFWGVCRGVGENHLGKILMEVRASLSA